MQVLWTNFKLEFVTMFEGNGNIFTILKTITDGLEALSCHYAVIEYEKYAEFYFLVTLKKWPVK